MSVYEHLEFRLLKYLVAVAESRTFTAAALRLHVAQSALSTQIRGLEDNLGIKIFDRALHQLLHRKAYRVLASSICDEAKRLAYVARLLDAKLRIAVLGLAASRSQAERFPAARFHVLIV